MWLKLKLSLFLVVFVCLLAQGLQLRSDRLPSLNQWKLTVSYIQNIESINLMLKQESKTFIQQAENLKSQINKLKLQVTSSENLVLTFQKQVEELKTSVTSLTQNADNIQQKLIEATARNNFYKIFLPVFLPVIIIIVGVVCAIGGYYICDYFYKNKISISR